MDEYSWASSVGHVRILELGFLTNSDLLKVAESEDLRSAISYLRDTSYGKHLESLTNPEEFAAALEQALEEQYRYVLSFCPDAAVILCFLSRYDFHNLKVLAKERLLGIPAEPGAVSSLSVVPFPDLKAVLEQTKNGSTVSSGSLPKVRPRYASGRGLAGDVNSFLEIDLIPALEGSFEKAHREALEGGGPFGVDSVIDREWMSWQLRYYRRHGYESLAAIAGTEADLTNLRIVIRTLYHGLDSSMLKKILLPGGAVSAEDIAGAYKASPERLANVYAGTRWETLAKSGLGKVQGREPLTEWEKACEDSLVEFYRAVRTRSLGPEPVLGFLYGKEVEVKNLRIILSGKQSQAPRERIVARIRRSYA